ncbi:SDR family NAD(P)-dependent oxidoreductase [Caldimonas sp. KR1-144]|uniref:SDR family NAD(P)-dependent oxidoreductase n=1 Tax=Caldimonas sp. KR1-144 TaxID=3400911 RepID=UPI003C060562
MTRSQLGTAVVTGASTGIGAIYADRLARRGHDLILVARNGARLDRLAEDLRARTGRTVRTMPADLIRPVELRAVEVLLRREPDITVLVNNAGVGALMPLLQSDVEDMQRMLDLNVSALTRLTYAAAPVFASRGRGTIINIASIVGIAPEILNGVYGASKAYVLALSQSLHHELHDKGVRIQAVLPGATATEFWLAAGNPVENLPPSIVMQADAMVDAALAGLDRGEVVTIPGLHQGEKWVQYEALRKELSGLFGHSTPAPRYLEREEIAS